MSDLSILVNNFELIREHKEVIMNHPPYRFSRIRLMHPSREGGDWYSQSMYLGAYQQTWDAYLERNPSSEVLPLFLNGSPLSGCVFKFLGIMPMYNKVTKRKPEGLITGNMLRPMWAFIKNNPERSLAVPLSQVVKEIKENEFMKDRESYHLLSFEGKFYQAVEAISGIPNKGIYGIEYFIFQTIQYRLSIQIEVLIKLDLSDEGKRHTVLDGSAVFVADIIEKAKKDIIALSQKAGFLAHRVIDSRTSWVKLNVARRIFSVDQGLQPDFILDVCNLLRDIQNRTHKL